MKDSFEEILALTVKNAGLDESGKSLGKYRKIMKDYLDSAFNTASHGYMIRLSKKICLVPIITYYTDGNIDKISKRKMSVRIHGVEFDIKVRPWYTQYGIKQNIFKEWYQRFRKIFNSDDVYQLIRRRI